MDGAKIIYNLNIIGLLQPGMTISSYNGNMKLMNHNEWWTSYRRMCNGNNRHNTICDICDVITCAINLLENNYSDELRQKITNALESFNNLTMTYKNDEFTVSKIKGIITCFNIKMLRFIMNEIKISHTGYIKHTRDFVENFMQIFQNE